MAEARPGLILVDGSAYIFRAFYALPQLNNSRGLPTNAIYGFTRMLVKLLKEAHPSHIAIVFDSPRKTFRDDLFESYKANRAAPPNDLVAQIPYIHRVVEAFRIKSLMVDGYEADDVIGTLAARAARQKFNTVIVTADKDFMQLVGPNVTLWDTMRDKRVGPREVRERFGVEPRAVVDIMALSGDPIDNVKGVPGVGEKSAAALIQHFGGVDELLRDPARIEQAPIRGAKRLAALVAEHRGAIQLARKLVKIDCDAPAPAAIESLAYHGIDPQAASELMRELEFDSLRVELGRSEDAALPASAAAAELRVSGGEIAAMVDGLRGTERLNLHLAPNGGGAVLKLAGENRGRVFVVEGQSIAAMRELLEAPAPPKSCHDLKEHLGRARKLGIEINGVDFDTMLAGFLVNPGRAEPSLDDLYHEHLAPLGGRPPASEPEVISALRRALQPRLAEDNLEELFRDIELPLAAVLAEMERVGIAVDARALRAMAAEFGEQLGRIERECFELAGRQFNLNSPIQLREVLFGELKLPTKGLKKTKSGYSTDVDALSKLAEAHALPRKLLTYRTLSKLKSTYADTLPSLIDPAAGRIHTSFHQALTATGRLSSSEPNLQNIPARSEEGRRIRRAFVAPPGSILLSADYSQIELRVLAHLSGDRTLVEAFAQGEDIHTRTASEVLGARPESLDAEARRLAKVINFGIIYGMGPQRLAGELGIPLQQASDYIKRYFERLPGVREYLEKCLREAREKGYVTTMFGRRRYLPELNSPQGGARAQAERIAINTPIQGSAADLIKIAMVRLEALIRERGLDARMLLQVHDELLFECGAQAREQLSAAVRGQMEGVASLMVPLRVELKWGTNWAEMRP